MELKNKIYIGMSVLKAHLLKKRIPIAVYLSVTDRCNLKCRYCNIPNKINQKELTTQQIFDLIDQVTALGAKRLQITGGEPMFRKDIGRIIDYAFSKGMYVTLSSNGFQIAERINELKNLGTLFLSIDGFKKSHDNHKGKGTFDRVIKALETAKKNGINVWVTTVISQKNYKDIAKFLEFMKEKGALVNVHLLYRVQEKLDIHFHLFDMPKDLIMKDDDIRKTLKEIIELKKKGAHVASSYGYLNLLLNWSDYSKIYSKKSIPGIKCWAGKFHCYVDTDGRVYPCGDYVGRRSALNFLDVGFKKAFECSNIDCATCIVACNVEQNLMFSLNLRTVWNWLWKVK